MARSGDVRPGLSLHAPRDGRLREAERDGGRVVRRPSRDQRAHSTNGVGVQLGRVVGGPTPDSLGMKDGAVTRASRHPAALGGLARVHQLVAGVQMPRVAARRVVAVMQGHLARLELATEALLERHPGDRSDPPSAGIPRLAVAGSIARTEPRPAGVGASRHVHQGPQLLSASHRQRGYAAGGPAMNVSAT
jgi:hypothetical protein